MQVDDVMPVEVQMYVNFEVQRAHLCWHVHGNRKRPWFFKQIGDLLQVNSTGNPCVLGASSVSTWDDGSYFTALIFGLKHASSLTESESRPKVVPFLRELQQVIDSNMVAIISLAGLHLLQAIRTVNE